MLSIPDGRLLICAGRQLGSAGAIDRLSQAGVVRWERLCGRLPRIPRLAASDHAASRQTPLEEAAGRESGNHVPFPATTH